MERIALLIESSNVEGQKDLPGARADIENWIKFLKSNIGGQWTNSEIVVFRKPYTSDIDNFLNDHKNKYCFIAFSGHGFHNPKDNRTKILLNDIFKEYDIGNMKPRGSKGTLLIDACRNVETPVFEQVEKLAEFSSRADFSNRRMEDFYSASDIWHQNLAKSLPGIVTMYSCDIGESADEYPKGSSLSGGIYTTALMSYARYWENSAANRSCYNTKTAHDDTASYMKKAYPQQNPVYSTVSCYFPFAVKA
jgi:hypothetical protein